MLSIIDKWLGLTFFVLVTTGMIDSVKVRNSNLGRLGCLTPGVLEMLFVNFL